MPSALVSRTPSLFAPFTRRNAGPEIRTQQTVVRGLIGESPNRCKSQVDRRRSQPSSLQFVAVSKNDSSTKRQARFSAINLIPAAMVASTWFFHYTRPVALPKNRRVLFGCGLVSSTFGALLLIGFLMVSFVDPSHLGHVTPKAAMHK